MNTAILKNKIVNNFIVLFTGDTISSIVNLISTSLIIKAIGLEENGIIIMIQTYALFFDQIFNFKIFEGLIRYLSISLENKDIYNVKSYIKQGLFLDLSTAILATFVGILLINPTMTLMGWDLNLKKYIYIYMLTVAFNISGVCIGILRTFNKFNYISYVNVITNVSKFILFIIGFFMKLGFAYFLIIEFLISISKNIMLIFVSFNTLKSNKLEHFYKVKLKIDREFLKFNLNINISSTIDLPVNTLTNFILNKYLGFELISIYKVFEKIGGLIGKVSSPLNQIIYPELNLLVAKDENSKAITLSFKLATGIFILGIIAISGVVITYKYWLYLLIPDYRGYVLSLILYMIYIIYINSTAVTHSLFIALGYVDYIIRVVFIINIIYLLYVVPFIKCLGLNGVILAMFLQSILVVTSKIIIMKKVKLSI